MTLFRARFAFVLGGMLAAALVSAAQAGPDLAQAAAPGPELASTGETGLATWYGEDFDGRLTADGERFDMYMLTAAHPTLPMGTLVEVTDLDNGRKVVVRINDRRPPAEGGVIVLSKAAAANLRFVRADAAHVSIRVVAQAPGELAPTTTARQDGADKGWRQASAR